MNYSELQFIEDVGLQLNQAGLPPVAGKVLGLLLVSNPPYLSHSEIVKALQVSKGGVTLALQILTKAGIVESLRVPGKRLNQFQIKENAWVVHLENQLANIFALKDLSEKGLKELQFTNKSHKFRLKELNDFYSWLKKILPAQIIEYKKSLVRKG